MASVTPPNVFGLWRAEPIILASRSKGRAALLERAHVPFDVVVSNLDERRVEGVDQLPPALLAARLAAEKARLVSMQQQGRIVIGADQTLALDSRMLHKAVSIDQACQQLRELAGRPHHLHSAVACFRDGMPQFDFIRTATIHMRPLSEHTIMTYAAAMGEALLQTVGGYEIESLGAHLIDRVEGDMFTVIGLPLFDLLAGFRRLGMIVEEAA